MRRVARRKLIIQDLQNKLQKYERRIQQMAENAYKVRQAIEMFSREAQDDAIHIEGSEGVLSGGGVSDREPGQPDVHDSATPEAVLEEQPAELSSNSGDLGINSGSAV